MHDKALFLHTGWRSAGTWIWHRFREQYSVMAFCEPLNDWLAEATPGTLLEPRPEIWPSRHPPMRPYFAEYAPLITSRGVAGYDRRFAYDRFFAAASERMSSLELYLRSLCSLAHEHDKLPVLKFTRSLGRVEWMRRAFPGAVHAVVVRSPFAQYRSAAQLYARGHRDFLSLPIALVAHSQDEATIAEVLSGLECDLRSLRRRTLQRTRVAAQEFVARNHPENVYRAMLAFWMSTTLTSMPFADVVIDASRLHESPDYRRHVEERIAELSNIEISLESAEPRLAGDLVTFTPSHETVRRLHRSAQKIFATFVTSRDAVNGQLLEKLA